MNEELLTNVHPILQYDADDVADILIPFVPRVGEFDHGRMVAVDEMFFFVAIA